MSFKPKDGLLLAVCMALGISSIRLARADSGQEYHLSCCDGCEACGELCSCQCRVDRDRAPQYTRRVSPLAIPSNTRHYGGGYVGGGATVLGQPRHVDEGTWGWDYEGVLFSKRIWLNWFHGRRDQGGGGSYKSEGPHVKLQHEFRHHGGHDE
jgi:hypothetical protein